jgi:hypothetical protein
LHIHKLYNTRWSYCCLLQWLDSNSIINIQLSCIEIDSPKKAPVISSQNIFFFSGIQVKWQADLFLFNNNIIHISESQTQNWICFYVMQLVIVGSDLINPFIYLSMFHSFFFIDYRELLRSTDSVLLVDLLYFFVNSANLFLRLGFSEMWFW